MNPVTWRGVPDAGHRGPRGLEWLRLLLRLAGILALTLLLLPFYLLLRLDDLMVPQRQESHRIAWIWARAGLFLAGLRLRAEPARRSRASALVANHSSWLDIWVLHSLSPAYFVAKSEVRGWPGIGLLARLSGAEFIRRDRAAASDQSAVLRERLAKGHGLCFFPEGTSSDGMRVLPFKPTLFAALVEAGRDRELWVQPVSVVYRPAAGLPDDFYGLWGGMSLGSHLLSVLARSRGGEVLLQLHDPVLSSDFADRKALARHCETVIRAGVEQVRAAS